MPPTNPTPQSRRPARKPTGKERAQAQSARSKTPPARSPIAARHQRNTKIAWFSVLGVLAAVAIIVIVAVSTSSTTPKTTASAAETTMAASVVKATTTVPAAIFDKVGITSSTAAINKPAVLPASTPPVTANGKPLVLYVGGEYCPYCAAERWALVASLSRFGTFTNLGATQSSSTDVDPSTHTFDFYHSSYQSPYVTFQPVEIYSGTPLSTGTGYTALQKLTHAQQALLTKFSTGSQGPSIPFVLVSNKLMVSGASYSPGILAGLTWSDIGSGLSSPTNPVSQAILATSNYISAGICASTNHAPASVCNSAGVVAAAKDLGLS